MHLFAGGGGGLLADLILGHNPIIAVEWEPYACQILRERAADGWFPDLRVWEGDVRLFDPSEYAGRVDIIHAGFPCQDISVAGKQTGLGEGTRSGLYREVLRIAGIVRPRYLFLENVSAIINLGLGTVLADLSALGYDARWITLRASDVGAPHHRDRWWCLAIRNTEHNGQFAESQLRGHEASSDEWRTEESQQTEQSEGADRPVNVSSIRRCKAGSKQQSSKQHADVAYSVGTRTGCVCGEVGTNRGWNTGRDESPHRQAHRKDGSDRVGATSGVAADVADPKSWESGETCTDLQRILAESDLCGYNDRQTKVESTKGWLDALCKSGASSANVADPTSSKCARLRSRAETQYSKFGSTSEDVSNANRIPAQRLEQEPQPGGHGRPAGLYGGTGGKPAAGSGKIVPGLGGVADELANRLDADQAFQGWWEIEPQIGRVTTDCKNRVGQLKALGNGQVPLQAAVAWMLLGGT